MHLQGSKTQSLLRGVCTLAAAAAELRLLYLVLQPQAAYAATLGLQGVSFRSFIHKVKSQDLLKKRFVPKLLLS